MVAANMTPQIKKIIKKRSITLELSLAVHTEEFEHLAKQTNTQNCYFLQIRRK